jgi:hypothetical protein
MPEFGPSGPDILGSAMRELVDLAYRVTDKLHNTTHAAADGIREGFASR